MPRGQDFYTLLLAYGSVASAATDNGTYRYVDAAGTVSDRGTFRVRALPTHKGRRGFSVICRSDEAPVEQDG